MNGSAWSWLLVLPAALLLAAALIHLRARRLIGLPRTAMDRWRRASPIGKLLVCILAVQLAYTGATKLSSPPPSPRGSGTLAASPAVAVVQSDAGDLDAGFLVAWPSDDRLPLDRVGLFSALELPGPSIMLGYNGEAPADKGGAPARIIQSWLANRSVMSDVDAWLKANANNRAWNACAIVKGQKYIYFRSRFKGLFKDIVEVKKEDW